MAPRAPSGLRLPAPRVSALLVLAFLGFGAILGENAGGPRADATLASARAHLQVVLRAPGPASASVLPTKGEASASGSAAEAPSTESAPAPTPLPAAQANVGSAGAPSGANAGPSGSGAGSSRSRGDASTPGGKPAPAAGAGPAKQLPPIKHVFVVMLSDEPYASVFGPASSAPYLSHTLERKGELLVRYDAVAHEQLANEVALLSGQGPTAETAANCPSYTEIAPASAGADEQLLGDGCVYPQATQTIGGELAAKHLSWRAYVQGIDEAGTPAGACPHPILGQADPTADQMSSSGAYASFRNPFIYFDSVVDTPECAVDDVGLDKLAGDLTDARRTPSFSYIVPDRCDDGNPTPCRAGAGAGVAQTNAFLEQLVPKITGSKAYRESGLLVITVDEAPSSGAAADSSACCGQPLFPNAPSETLGGAPRGGGTVGALLLSPYVAPGTISQEPFNHLSLLHTIEDLFAVKHLGYAGLPAVKSFEPAMFTAAKHGSG